ncbi:MAG: metallophosphoesterase [Parasutterella sp.]
MFLFWPSLILAVYVVCSGVLPLKIHWFWKLLSAAVIFLISMKYMAYTMNGGTFFEPAVKGAWMLTWEALYGALILAAFLLLLKDICSLGLWLLGTFGVKTGFSFNRLVFIVPFFIVSVAGGFWGMYEGIKVPEVKTETIVFKNLPAQWKGTTIALLSDLHVGPVQRKEWLSEIVKRTNDLNPDIVMVTGDFIDGRVQNSFLNLNL